MSASIQSMKDFLNQHPQKVAPQLLGWSLVRVLNGNRIVGRIVETEAYHQTDAASHSYRGQTPRTEVMFGPSGYAYVYFTYGMHYCMNVVTGPAGEGGAVLIRALEPTAGIDVMESNRQTSDVRNMTNGPAKLCQALRIDKSFNGMNLFDKTQALYLEPLSAPVTSQNIINTTRIGISKDTHRLWRFYIRDNDFISRK